MPATASYVTRARKQLEIDGPSRPGALATLFAAALSRSAWQRTLILAQGGDRIPAREDEEGRQATDRT